MNPNFNKIVAKLKHDPELTGVSIFDLDSHINVTKKPVFGNEMDVKNYFEDLQAKGHHNLSIQEIRKNGSSVKKIGKPFTVSFSSQQNTANVMQNYQGLNGAVAFGGHEALNLLKDQDAKERLEVENAQLKAENIQLKAEKEKLEKELLMIEFSDRKSQSFNENLSKALPIAQELIQGLFFGNKGGATPSLAAPAVQEQQQKLSGNKAFLVQELYNPNLPEAMATILVNVLGKLNQSSEFFDELTQLLEKYTQTE
jgi:hypothetical protein